MDIEQIFAIRQLRPLLRVKVALFAPVFWQGCELQVTLDAQRIAIRTSAPVSLRLNGQLITVAEESVFCLGDFILPFNGTATKHQEDE